MAVFYKEKPFIIRVEVPKGEIRLCDYCNRVLVDEEACVVQECFTTHYGLVCGSCLGRIRPLKGYKAGDNVYFEDWY